MQKDAFDYKALGSRIRIARDHQRITQAGLASEIGCDPKHLSAIENGRKRPSLELLTKISMALNVTTDYLLQDSEYVSQISVELAAVELLKQMNQATKKNVIDIMKSCLMIQKSVHEERP